MISFQLQDFEPFHHLLISLGLGLLVGLQREWAESPLAGIRSFSLICVTGTVSAQLSATFGDYIVALAFIGVLSVLLVARLSLGREKEVLEKHGIVSELSVIIVFFIGVMVHLGPTLLAASLAGLLAVVLQVKLELHTLASRFNKNEIRSIMQFVLVLLVIFPIVPDNSFGPYNAINPHNIWLMVVLITGISLVGYIVYKFFGSRAGVLLNGFLGGMISSTATTITCSRNAHRTESSAPYNALIILMAWLTLYLRVYLELAATAPSFKGLTWPLVILTVVSIIPILFMWKKARKHLGDEISTHPTELKTAITFALMYGVILLLASYFKAEFGGKGLMVLAFISGVVDVDAMTLSTGRLVSVKAVGLDEGRDIILSAIISNNFFKGLLAYFVGGRKLFKTILLPWAIVLFTGVLLLLFWN